MDIVNDVPTVVILLVASLIIGCIFGSFLNVVIWRVPNHISITNPKRSFCPKCESPIAWYDNIPIFSWLALGAKCRHCKEPIAARYPLVESLGGLSFLAVTAGGLFGAYPLWALPVLYVFACVSIVIAFIDLDHHLILNVVLLPTLIATVLLLVVASFGIGEWNRLGRGALCALILFVFYFVLSLIWKGGMGDGDIKLAFILGLLLGWLGWRRHPLWAIHAARRMAWHFRRRTNRHTIPATHRTCVTHPHTRPIYIRRDHESNNGAVDCERRHTSGGHSRPLYGFADHQTLPGASAARWSCGGWRSGGRRSGHRSTENVGATLQVPA